MKQYNYRHIKTSIVWKQEWNRSVSLFPKFGSINMAELQEKMKSKQSNEALKTKMSEAKRMKETEGLHAMGTSANTEEQDKVK